MVKNVSSNLTSSTKGENTGSNPVESTNRRNLRFWPAIYKLKPKLYIPESVGRQQVS